MSSFIRGIRSISVGSAKSKGEEESFEDDFEGLENMDGELEHLDDLNSGKNSQSKSHDAMLTSTKYPFNSKQTKLIAAVRKLCEKELSLTPNFEEVVSDRRIMRFLRGHNFDTNVAARMYKAMLLWRNQSDVNAIRDRIVSENMEPKDFPHYGRIHRYYPSQTNVCKDNDGRPVHIELLGNVTPRKMLSSFSEEEWMTFHKYACEYNSIHLDNLTKEHGELTRIILLYDLKGCGAHHLRSKKGWALVKNTLQITQDFYPETMHQTWLLNVPKVFTLAWQLLKPCLAERTVKKIQILATKDMHKVFSSIPKEGLPVSLGGTKRDCWPLIFDKQEFKKLDDEHQIAEIGKGSKYSISFKIPENSFVVWGYFLKSGDINAKISVTDISNKPTEGEEEEEKESKDTDELPKSTRTIAYIERGESSGGSFEVKHAGEVELSFDNSFSWIMKKKVHFYVLFSHQDSKHHLDSPRNGTFKQFL